MIDFALGFLAAAALAAWQPAMFRAVVAWLIGLVRKAPPPDDSDDAGA